MSEEKPTWTFPKIAGGIGIAFATAFFALTIRFVSEIRSELTEVKAILEERTGDATHEITRLRNFSGDNRQLANKSLLLVEKLEKRVDLILDSHIMDLRRDIQESERTPP